MLTTVFIVSRKPTDARIRLGKHLARTLNVKFRSALVLKYGMKILADINDLDDGDEGEAPEPPKEYVFLLLEVTTTRLIDLIPAILNGTFSTRSSTVSLALRESSPMKNG